VPSDETIELVRSSLSPLLSGTIEGTIPLTAISFVCGLVVALLVALMRLSSVRPVAALARFYVSVIRGTPLLLQLFIIYYGLPSMGVTIDPFPSACIAFTLNVGGYASEIIRAAILSVPKGQSEAAATVGMDYATTLRRDRPAAGHARRRAHRCRTRSSRSSRTRRWPRPSRSPSCCARRRRSPAPDVRVLHALHRRRRLLLGDLLALSFSQSRVEGRLDRYVAT
jgi:cystine transport system permease protein